MQVTKIIADFLATPDGKNTGLSSTSLKRRMAAAGFAETVSAADGEAVKRSLRRIAGYRVASASGSRSETVVKTAAFGQDRNPEILHIAKCPLCRRDATPNVRTADGMIVDYCQPCRLPIPRVVPERK